MKTTFKVIGIAIMTAIVLNTLFLTGCGNPAGGDGDGNGGGGGGGGTTQTFTSIAAFRTWLDAHPSNTVAAAYNVKLNVSDLGEDSYTYGSVGNALYDNDTKYVYLDLSGSTFTSIEDSAFSHCQSLTGITIPASVTSIGNSAFACCTSLTSITIPDSITSIGDGAFWDCTSLTAINVESGNTAYSSENGVLYNKTKTMLVKYPEGKTGSSFTIPSSVTNIESSAFEDCTSLININIPNSVTSIGDYAFNCENLTSITIPASVTSIGDYAFAGCDNLTSVTFQGTITSTKFTDNAFYGLGNLRDKFYATDTTNGTPGTYARASGGTTWTKN